MTYQPVLTDEGLEIRDNTDEVVWGPSEQYAWPPSEEMMEVVFEDANISNPNKAVLRLITGLVDIQDERSEQS